MRMRLGLPLGIALTVMSFLVPSVALAHEGREVGNYSLEVGFLNEPAYQNQLNGMILEISTKADDKPVEGAEKTLKAEVIVGGNARQMPLTLEPQAQAPGTYVGSFVPTATGAYIFHISGTIEGQPVDERFESGPGRFSEVQSLQALQFPFKLADPAMVQSRVADAQATASSARTLGIAGIVVGALGLLAAGLALARQRAN